MLNLSRRARKRPSRAQLAGCSLIVALAWIVSGCSTNPIVVTAEELCKDWQHQQIRKADQLTDPTASQIEANNMSRPNWGCQYGENRAKPTS